jgi:hypothetical protein
MWIPAGVIYLIAGLALMLAWLKESERRVSSPTRFESLLTKAQQP